MNYLFMELFSQSFEVSTQLGDFINPELAEKRAQTPFPSCIAVLTQF